MVSVNHRGASGAWLLSSYSAVAFCADCCWRRVPSAVGLVCADRQVLVGELLVGGLESAFRQYFPPLKYRSTEEDRFGWIGLDWPPLTRSLYHSDDMPKRHSRLLLRQYYEYGRWGFRGCSGNGIGDGRDFDPAVHISWRRGDVLDEDLPTQRPKLLKFSSSSFM